MTPERQIYLLNPQELGPETIAVAFAKTSRSPQSFREIAAELTDDSSAQFHEKWVVGYGHASVAEHAVLHIAVENVSRLAIECLESNRLASYTEKSTRYQTWSPDSFYIPQEFADGEPRQVYEQACRALFETYSTALPRVRELVARQVPRKEEESEAAWDRRVRSRYVDVCRYLLPAASLANVGVTANARVLEHAICKMLSHPLEEVRQIGARVKEVARAQVPTLVKYADQLPYLQGVCAGLTGAAAALYSPAPPSAEWCQMVHYEPDGERRVLAAALVRFGQISYTSALDYLEAAGTQEIERIAGLLLDELGPHDSPVREFEHTGYTFDVVIDQGAYFELKRHRMMTQTPAPLSTDLGYAAPAAFEEAGIGDEYRKAMEAARTAYNRLARENSDAAAYLVPNGFCRRVLLTLNLRSAFHLVQLRSADNAHFAIRRLAQRMADQIRSVHPLLSRAMRANPEETWEGVEREFFSTP